MIYCAEDIRVEQVDGLIRKRPGMYIGDLGHLGTARLIGLAVKILAALTVNRETVPFFNHHAFLDVVLSGREVTVSIDYHPDESPDLSERCVSLIENRNNMRPDEYALEQELNSVAPLPILSALSTGLHILKSGKNGVESILFDESPLALEPSKPTKGALVTVRFMLRELIDSESLSQDYLEGFLQGCSRVPGLLVRNVSINVAA